MLSAEGRVEVIRSYARAHPEIRTFVETGSADGSTTAALVDEFDRLYTIELDVGLYYHNLKRFVHEPKVLPMLGDSAVVLKELLLVLDRPAVFWVDAHWCGGETRGPVDTPVESELREIFYRRAPGVVLIDDARLFGTDPAYPTVDWVQALVATSESSAEHGDLWEFEIADDVMRITPLEALEEDQ